MTPKLILASSSPYRKALIEKLFDQPLCISPEIDERAVHNECPRALSIQLGEMKARAVAAGISYPALVIGSDQMAILDQSALHKPGNAQNNREQLKACSGKSVHFYTSICVVDTASNTMLSDCDETIVRFRKLTEDEITRYVEKEPSFDCAGGFKVEGLGVSLFESIESQDPNALIGLPMIKLCQQLARFGVSPLSK